jgi:hypothetical protein
MCSCYPSQGRWHSLIGKKKGNVQDPKPHHRAQTKHRSSSLPFVKGGWEGFRSSLRTDRKHRNCHPDEIPLSPPLQRGRITVPHPFVKGGWEGFRFSLRIGREHRDCRLDEIPLSPTLQRGRTKEPLPFVKGGWEGFTTASKSPSVPRCKGGGVTDAEVFTRETKHH